MKHISNHMYICIYTDHVEKACVYTVYIYIYMYSKWNKDMCTYVYIYNRIDGMYMQYKRSIAYIYMIYLHILSICGKKVTYV